VPQVVVTDEAALGLERCRLFLADKDRRVAARAAAVIKQQMQILKISPEVGRPVIEQPGLRELLISFGDSGYIALYRYVPADNAVYVLAFRHQKEATY
jgi:plasmid stabilization system protein ParE